MVQAGQGVPSGCVEGSKMPSQRLQIRYFSSSITVKAAKQNLTLMVSRGETGGEKDGVGVNKRGGKGEAGGGRARGRGVGSEDKGKA